MTEGVSRHLLAAPYFPRSRLGVNERFQLRHVQRRYLLLQQPEAHFDPSFQPHPS